MDILDALADGSPLGTFVGLVDRRALTIQPAHLVSVNRYKEHKGPNSQRLLHGADLIGLDVADLLILPREVNTLEEILTTFDLMDRLDLTSVIFVTELYHSYRVYLTAIHFAGGKDIQVKQVDNYRGFSLKDELPKIEEYQKRGDIATYEEGIAWLSSGSRRRT